MLLVLFLIKLIVESKKIWKWSSVELCKSGILALTYFQVVGEEVNIMPKKEVKEEATPGQMETFDQFLPFNSFYSSSSLNNNTYPGHDQAGLYPLKQFNGYY